MLKIAGICLCSYVELLCSSQHHISNIYHEGFSRYGNCLGFFLIVELFVALTGCFLYERNGTYVPLSITGENNPISGNISLRDELFAKPRVLRN